LRRSIVFTGGHPSTTTIIIIITVVVCPSDSTRRLQLVLATTTMQLQSYTLCDLDDYKVQTTARCYGYNYTDCRYESPPPQFYYHDHSVNAAVWSSPSDHDHHTSVYNSTVDESRCERFSNSAAAQYPPLDDVTYYFRRRRCPPSYDYTAAECYCGADVGDHDGVPALVEAWTPQHENCPWMISDDRCHRRTFYIRRRRQQKSSR